MGPLRPGARGGPGATAACSGQCSQCGRALRACEWCGEAGVLSEGGREFPVIARPEWDGAYHEPCWDAEQQVRSGGAVPERQHLAS